MSCADDESRIRNRFTRRALLVGGTQTALLGLIGHRLYDLQINSAERYALLADENRINVQGIAPIRGNIHDRFGLLLAESRENLEVTIIPDLARDVPQVLDRLAGIIKLDAEERARVVAATKRQSKLAPILVRAGLTWEEFARVNVLAPQLPGVFAQVGMKRVYYRGSDVGHVVGLVSLPDKDDLNVDPALRLPNLKIGKSGVELGMEAALRGEPGEIRREIDAHGRIVRDLNERPSVNGRNLMLTIDTELQASVLKRMAAEDHSAVVALDARSGDILSLASTPVYDTAAVAEGISAEDWKRIVETPGNPLVSKAIRGQYPPGSTFKMVTALAALDAGLVTTKTRITCRGEIEIAGQRFGCWKRGGHGGVRLNDALRLSCDVYFYELAKLCGIERIADMARRLGFGQIHQCGIGGQKPGLIPDTEWKRSALNRRWFLGETLHAAIGQGYVLATPLQLAVMTARLATGKTVTPRLIRQTLAGATGDVVPDLGISTVALDAVRAGLRAAVNEGGTGSAAHLGIKGVVMAGKTGTAQVTKLSRGRSSASLERRLRDHSLFVGYAPYEAPRYAVAAIVEHGGGGSAAAAPLVRDVMRMLIERDPAAMPAYPEIVPSAERAGTLAARG
jgi:penicillin-binding protein 2